MTIDTNIIWNQINTVKEGLGSMQKAVNSFTHATVKRRVSTFFEKIELNIANALNKFDSFREIIEEIPSHKRRTKRFFCPKINVIGHF
jgi:ASC-1-like (ASCH) protein